MFFFFRYCFYWKNCFGLSKNPNQSIKPKQKQKIGRGKRAKPNTRQSSTEVWNLPTSGTWCDRRTITWKYWRLWSNWTVQIKYQHQQLHTLIHNYTYTPGPVKSGQWTVNMLDSTQRWRRIALSKWNTHILMEQNLKKKRKIKKENVTININLLKKHTENYMYNTHTCEI